MSRIAPGALVDGRWEVERLLGRGGMAAVWMVRHASLGTVKALKVLELRSSAIDRRFELEGRLQAKIRHPHVVRVEDVLIAGGAPALLLEYVDGVPLDLLLAKGIPTMAEAIGLFQGIALAVAAAHAAGAVHRDLKPGNVMVEVRPEGLVPRVTDFGLAKITDEAAAGPRRTRTNTALGTPEYMAHEQLGDASRVGTPADVFALGVILFELVTGEVPWVGADMATQVRARTARGAPDPAQIRPDIPAAAVEVIRGALREDPAERPKTVDEILVALYGSSAFPAPPVTGPLCELARKLHASPPTVASEARTATPPVLRPPERPTRGRRVAQVAGVGVLVVLGCGGLLSGFAGTAWWLGLGRTSAIPIAAPTPVTAPAPAPVGVAPEVEPPGERPNPGEAPGGPTPHPEPVARPQPPIAPPETAPAPMAPPPTPAPIATPAPVATPVPANEGALLSIRGADRAWLEADGHRYSPGARVPPGAYHVLAIFEGGAPISAGDVLVTEGQQAVSVRCTAALTVCKAE